jgi:hypothetical protein
VARLAT